MAITDEVLDGVQGAHWLTGPWAPVDDELDVGGLEVRGELPPSLRGTFLRNGPNPAFAPIGAYHVFDGDGMVHGVEIGPEGARYRNRWVRNPGFEAEQEAGHALYGGLASFQLPPQEVIDRAGALKNTANTHVVRHAGRVLALMEAAPPIELTEALETVGTFDFGGALQGPMTAHPKADPETGELVFFGYSPFPPYLRYHVADAEGRLTTSVPIDLPGPVMMHDVAVSRDHVVFFDLPASFDLPAMLAGEPGIRWRPELGARLGVLDRSHPRAPVRWVEVEPFWAFHFLNAHDDGDAVVVEGCRAPRLNTTFGDEPLDEPVLPLLHRWRIDPVAGTVADEPLDDRPSDFPRVADGVAGLPARFGYVGHTRSWDVDEVVFDGFTKHDLRTGASWVHRYGPEAVAGEPVFAPDPERADDEDGGWVVGLVHDRAEDRSALVVTDAQALEEVARVLLPRRVPLGFHGSWLPAGS